MARKIVSIERGTLTRKERAALKKAYRDTVHALELPEAAPAPAALPFLPKQIRFGMGFWMWALTRPYHRGTGYQVAAANLFAAAALYAAAGPIIGLERLSGGRAFTFDPWELYRQRLCSSPNLLIQGALRQGKSFFIKRLLTFLILYGRKAINTSDSKGEHGVVAEALGGTVFKLGVYGSPIRINPLEASARRPKETAEAHRLRVKADRNLVLQQIVGLLTPGERQVTSREAAILNWAIAAVVADTGDRPTIRLVWEKIASPAYLAARDGKFQSGQEDELLDALDRLIDGDLAGMFDTESTIKLDPACPYTVIDTFAIAQRGDTALAVTQAVTNAWVLSTISNKDAGIQYLLIREEGWLDMRSEAALKEHQKQLKLSGEYGVAMVLIVHEDGDFDSVGNAGSIERELASSLLRGYANRISFWQPAAGLQQAVADGTFTEAEAAAITSLRRGEFLVKIKAGSYVVDGNPTTTEWERTLFDTDRQMRAREGEAEQVHG